MNTPGQGEKRICTGCGASVKDNRLDFNDCPTCEGPQCRTCGWCEDCGLVPMRQVVPVTVPKCKICGANYVPLRYLQQVCSRVECRRLSATQRSRAWRAKKKLAST